MKNGYKHYTGKFGTDAEYYVATLFGLHRSVQAKRRPDLYSPEGYFDYPLHLEIKSGRSIRLPSNGHSRWQPAKGVLVDYQLCYESICESEHERNALQLPKQTIEFFGRQIQLEQKVEPSPAFYYNIISRWDNIRSGDIRKPFSTIQLEWGDQFIVPAKFALYAFATARVMRTGEDFTEVMNYLRSTIAQDLENKNGTYLSRKLDPQSWQDIHGRDILALFHNDPLRAAFGGRQRMDLIRHYYSDCDSLQRIQIRGPNNTSIYVLAEQKDCHLFDQKVRATIAQNTPVVEQLTSQRKQHISLLEKFVWEEQPQLNLNGQTLYRHPMVLRWNVTDDNIALLKRLSRWKIN